MPKLKGNGDSSSHGVTGHHIFLHPETMEKINFRKWLQYDYQ